MVLSVLSNGVALRGQAEEGGEEEALFELDPFVVEGDTDVGYRASHTLGGTRIRTSLEDVGASIQAITADFLEDTGATDNRSLLQYTASTEVGGVDGNFGGAGNGVGVYESFGNPSHTTRVRGLAAADNTRNYFLTDIPWDAYNVERVDIQRGPNAVLFGFGSPAGIINTGLIRPQFTELSKIQLRTDGEGSKRANFDVNREVLAGELAVRLAGVYDHENYRQDPAYENDERLWAGVEYRPKFLQTERGAFTVNVSYEKGEIRANRPRTITPIDRITPWFEDVYAVAGDPNSGYNPAGGIGKGVYTPSQLQNNRIPPTPNAGQALSNYEDGTPNPYFVPALGNFGFVFGGPAGFVGRADNGEIDATHVLLYRERNGLGPDGQVDGKIDGNYYASPGGVDTYNEFARKAGLPYAEFGQYKHNTLTDRSIFDYYNHLLDGPNKEEYQEFENLNLTLRQTFLNNSFGIEFAHDWQDYYQSGTSLVVDDRQAIMIDLNSEFTDGTANPNVGRPYITDSGQFGNWSMERERESTRLTGFAQHDFEKHSDGFWARLLGRQSLTGVYSEESVETQTLSWQRHAMGADFREFIGVTSIVDNFNAFSPVIYLGPSLLGAESAVGAQIPALKTRIEIPDQVTVTLFDDTWNAPGVNPAALWQHPGGYASTQSENPANYVGWTDKTFSIQKVDARNPAALARNGNLSMDEIESKVLVLQNYFWDGAIVGAYGWREDTARVYRDDAQIDPLTNRALIEAMRIPDGAGNATTAQSHSWSAVVHLHRLPKLRERLPLDVSLYYSESGNFQPDAGRIDLFGRSLAPSSGDTVDRAVLLQTKDGRYSLKVTRFTTAVENTSASGINGQWFLGWAQAWGENWKNIFKLNTISGTDNTGRTIFNTYAPKQGQTQVEANTLEAAAVAGWEAHVDNLRALSTRLTGNPDAFDQTFQIDRDNLAYTGITASDPGGLTFTEDVVSEGWEFELTARPTSNWDLTFNASKVKATRQNIGGEALVEYVNLVNDDLNNTAAGDLRIYGGWVSAPTIRSEWNSIFNGNYQLQQLLEGTAVPELREWRFNLVTNYHFTDGFLSGFNIGGGYRWQDKVVIGFKPEYTDASETEITYDLNDPYYGPSEDNIDLWIGYYKRILGNVDWHIQLNVRNVFADKGLIPVNTQPDGSVGAWRLGAATTWSITSTFTF